MKKLISFFLLLSSALFPESLDFSELVKEQRNSVVNIESTRRIETRMSRSYGGFSQELFREIGFSMPDQKEQRPQQREGRSTGAGFVLSRDGYVIKKFHVVEGAAEVVG